MNVCITEDCDRPSKTKVKPGLCGRCYGRQHYGWSKRTFFPTQPLLDYAERHGIGFGRNGRPENKTITLEKLDALCIDLLGVHPYEVYGDLYFTQE